MRIETRLRASIVAASLLVFGLDTGVALPQSLGDVARRESERRSEAAKAPGRVYTNENLAAIDPPREEPPQSEPARPLAQETASAPTAASPGGVSAAKRQPATDTIRELSHERRDEGQWRARAKEVRGRLAKASADLESTRSSLSALDNGPNTPAAARERVVVAAAVQRLQSDVRSRQLEETQLRAQAEINKIPAEWIQ